MQHWPARLGTTAAGSLNSPLLVPQTSLPPWRTFGGGLATYILIWISFAFWLSHCQVEEGWGWLAVWAFLNYLATMHDFLVYLAPVMFAGSGPYPDRGYICKLSPCHNSGCYRRKFSAMHRVGITALGSAHHETETSQNLGWKKISVKRNLGTNNMV